MLPRGVRVSVTQLGGAASVPGVAPAPSHGGGSGEEALSARPAICTCPHRTLRPTGRLSRLRRLSRRKPHVASSRVRRATGKQSCEAANPADIVHVLRRRAAWHPPRLGRLLLPAHWSRPQSASCRNALIRSGLSMVGPGPFRSAKNAPSEGSPRRFTWCVDARTRSTTG